MTPQQQIVLALSVNNAELLIARDEARNERDELAQKCAELEAALTELQPADEPAPKRKRGMPPM